MRYAELHAHSAFSFLDGASQPEELVTEAARCGLAGVALTDHDGLYGVVRFAEAARAADMPSIFGAELTLSTVRPRGAADPVGEHLLILARGRQGYQRLSRAIATAHLAAGRKGQAHYRLSDLAEHAGDVGASDREGHWMILTGCRKGSVRKALEPAPGVWDVPAATAAVNELVELFGRRNVAVEITDHGAPLDAVRCHILADLAYAANLPVVATSHVHTATPAGKPLADALAAVRARRSLDELDGWLPAQSGHIRTPQEMAYLHRQHPQALTATVDIAQQCAFDLHVVAPNLPPHPVPPGHTEASWLRHLTYQGARQRYGPPESGSGGAYSLIEHELNVITELNFPGYFLIVHEIVEFCRRNQILCQGRGSAANSAVCYALGITAVDAVKHRLLFERFLSLGCSGPPDIDIDIESRRREEVIQFVYSRYGRRHAAQVANVISYRPRSAIRDAAKAFGYDVGQQDAWSKGIERWGSLRGKPAPSASDLERGSERERLHRDGPWVPPVDPSAADLTSIPSHVVDMAEQMLRLPRHLGIHSGGMVLCEGQVIDVCPTEWASMPGRTVLQWDKDDCADAGLVKFDLLGLGMLTALRLAFEWINELEGVQVGLHSIPQEDPAVYDLLCAADTVGVFQVESRAQMATLPRLRPRCFYDIVVEVALIRPGPIQGNSVHPFINRKNGREPVTYLHPLLEPALAKTLGVPLFQEQLMQIAIDVADFSPAEADRLRRAMGSKRSADRMEALHARLLEGMARNGIDAATGEKIFDKLKAFADFGFPESHAFSFAYLVYASAWLKVHHPAAFYAALLAAQPMGFYSPASLVADARRHGVRVERADVAYSQEQACVQRMPDGGLGVRLGLAPVRAVGTKAAQRLVATREQAPFVDIADLSRRVGLRAAQLEALATAGALASFGHRRREGIWLAGALAGESGQRQGDYIQEPLPWTAAGLEMPQLPQMDKATRAVSDVWATGVSVDSFPTQFRRSQLQRGGVLTLAQVPTAQVGSRVRVAGVVTHRQRPATARGVTFLSLEDETGLLNVICTAGVWARYRQVARGSAALVIRGIVEHADGVTNLMADKIEALTLRVPSSSRDFR
ncbi:MAG: error-prone DNA polymerase [Beutenbergiaceae bacterium]